MRIPSHAVGLGIATMLVSAIAYAFTVLNVEPPVVLSVADAPSGALGTGASKSKLLAHRDGTLVMVYGDFVAPPPGVAPADFLVYDLKTQAERPPRDVFARRCKPGEDRGDGRLKTCMVESDWTAPVNLSVSATATSLSTDWRGDLDAESARTFWGDAEKPNGFVNPGGVTVVSWVSHYCPDGDPGAAAIDAPVQRARLYTERDNRIIPFTCTWVNYSTDHGQTWLAEPIQLSSGLRAAKQDVNRGTNSFWTLTWQEDPTGLELGEAEGPGDGASGARVSGGTDIWYARAPVTNAGTTIGAWGDPVRLTDNSVGTGTAGTPSTIVYGVGATPGVADTPVDEGGIETGQTGASRANLGSSMSTVLVAWEETKGSGIPHSGKFIRYLHFPNGSPPAGVAGCIVSDPTKIARRARFVTQNPADAGTDGMHMVMFWREGEVSQGGPADIMLRRAIGGVSPDRLQPAVDFGGNNTDAIDCTTSVYDESLALESALPENISSRTKEVAASGVDNLADDTELQAAETALAHRALLRGERLWLGYLYAEDLAGLRDANTDNYNFWIRPFNWDRASGTGTWRAPQQISHVTDTDIIAREPRMVGTPPDGSNCPTDPTDCRNPEVFYVAWGTQTNTLPTDIEPPRDLGLWITRTTNGGGTYEPVVQLSSAQGAFGGPPTQDEEAESAFESQIRLRPDGDLFHAVWNQRRDTATGTVSRTEFTRGEPLVINGNGGCTTRGSGGNGHLLLPGMALLALAFLGFRRWRGRGQA